MCDTASSEAHKPEAATPGTPVRTQKTGHAAYEPLMSSGAVADMPLDGLFFLIVREKRDDTDCQQTIDSHVVGSFSKARAICQTSICGHQKLRGQFDLHSRKALLHPSIAYREDACGWA